MSTLPHVAICCAVFPPIVRVKEGIGTLCIGKNDGWKQEANMGKRNNQNFVQIPHMCFIQMLIYKAELVGITVKITEECIK